MGSDNNQQIHGLLHAYQDVQAMPLERRLGDPDEGANNRYQIRQRDEFNA